MSFQNTFAKIAIITGLTACEKNEAPVKKPSLAVNRISLQQTENEQHSKIRFENIGQVFRDTSDVIWESIPLDKEIPASVSLSFLNDTALYFYHGQCIYYYPVTLQGNGITLHWDWIEDCVFDRGLKRKFRLPHTPEIGKPFSRFELKNDTTLQVTYMYPEWVKQINVHSNTMDTIYPVLFQVRKFN